MDPESQAIKLCIEGTQAEYEGRVDDARALYRQAWESSRDDYEACIAAHYVARHQGSPEDALRWNLEALARARAAGDIRVESFYPSLYVNLGRAYGLAGNQSEAERYYELAASLGLVHQAGPALKAR